MLSISLYFPIPDNGESETHGMVCHEHKELTAQKSWLKLENVTSYEDIPENEKNNLSNDTRERLKTASSHWYTVTNYRNLSRNEKNHFDAAIDTGGRLNRRALLNRSGVDRYIFTDSLILYEGGIYSCDIDRLRGGS
mgnify:CR=1 FL=1